MTTDTSKHDRALWPILSRRMPAARTLLTGIICVNLNRQTAVQPRLVCNHRLQFRKRPFAHASVCPALLLRSAASSFPRARRAFSNVCQMFHADQSSGLRYRSGDAMIDIRFEPSLSSAQGDKTPCCRPSAFALQRSPRQTELIREVLILLRNHDTY